MIRECSLVLAGLAMTACTAQRVSLEGLRPRPAEAIDPRIPLPTEAVGKPVDTSLASRIAQAERSASEGSAAFEALLPQARVAAGNAGAKGSESWIEAEELLSALVGARAPLTLAIADLDALAGRQVVAAGDIGVSDRDVLFAAVDRLAAIDRRQQADVAAIRNTLAR